MSVQEQQSSFTSTTKKTVQVTSSSVGGVTDQIKDHHGTSLSSCTSASSIDSSSTFGQREFGNDFVFKPTIMNFDSLIGMMGNDFEDVTRDISKGGDGKTFEMKLEVQDYRPDEIKVKVSDNLVTVSAKQESRSENSSSSRQFCKKFTLPQGVKPESIVCSLNQPQGVLKITAPIESTQQSITSSQQHKQVSKTQAESCTSSRKSSVTSDVSSLRDFDEFVVRPKRLDLSSLDISSTSDISRELGTVNDGKKFEMKIEVKNFKAEEVQVKISKGLIKIEAKHESEFKSYSFFKEFTIPCGVQANEVTCVLNDEGILTVSAPIHQPTHSSQQNISSTSQTQTSSVHQKKLHETGRTDSTGSSVSSVASSKRVEDFILPSIMNFDMNSIKESMLEDVSKQVCHVNEGKKFEMKLDVPEYKPEELKIKIANSMVIIEGKQETSTSSRQFSKKFTIPYGVKGENIKSSLSPSGVLTISAPITEHEQQQQTIQQSQHQTQQLQQQQHHTQQSQQTIQTSQTQSVSKKEQHHQQSLNQTHQQQHSDSNTSLGSTLSSISNDFNIRPIIDLNAVMAKDTHLFEDISKNICQIQDGKKFETKIDVPDYQPNELKVKISNNMVTISGKQEMRNDTNFSCKSFQKKFSIPQGVKPEDITSSLSPSGVLTISAPVDLAAANNQVQHGTTVTTSTQVTRSEQVIGGSGRPQIVLKPKMNMDSSTAAVHSGFEDVSKDIYHVCDGQTFEMKLPIDNYKPEEIEVKISNNVVTIEGSQKIISSQNDDAQYRHFSKKFTIPEGVRPTSIVCTFNSDGYLMITAPIEDTHKNNQNLMESQHNQQVSQSHVSKTTKVSQTFSSTSSSSNQQVSSSTQQQIQ